MGVQSRRDFFKHAALLSGAAGLTGALPASIQRAFAIDPEPGSTFLDAEHVVILMQENRSFDHAYGTLRGVRGFNDPRVMTLPNGNPVWAQTNDQGETFAPFRLNIKDTNATWMGSLPHSWTDQVDARNGGKYDRWLQAKASGHAEYALMPLTMGYYDREDIPFYYELADAFTICDQHFCSSLTGTTPNRLYLWSGTVRQEQHADSYPKLFNSEADYGSEVSWTTFPERLEDAGVSWRIYQNELSVGSGLQGEADAWLGNFTDNSIEFFTQYQVRFLESRRKWLRERVAALPQEIAELEAKLNDAGAVELVRERRRLERMKSFLAEIERELPVYTQENWDKLTQREKNLHQKAFTTNTGDPDYHSLVELKYMDGGVERTVSVPKGDVLHQFRQDVNHGKLPTVSWLVAPEAFSDHPGSAWYGAWYIAEALNILTENPEVWKKTIFLLTYDENDGYFDHVPPFTAPNSKKPETGKVSQDIDASVEYVELEQELKHKAPADSRESSIGLGYRVPLVIASPWSRGGCVCSQVFDHTSPLQFLETLLTHKTGKPIKEENISAWRRAVCGDLTSSFQPFSGDKTPEALRLDRDEVVEGIHRAKFKQLPAGFRALNAEQVAELRKDAASSPFMPRQETGVRKSSPLPYELAVDGQLSEDRRQFVIKFSAGKQQFGEKSAGSPFIVFARSADGEMAVRNYAVSAGDRVSDAWNVADFAGGKYHFAVHGPNGFFREFIGSAADPKAEVRVEGAANGDVAIHVSNRERARKLQFVVADMTYRRANEQRALGPGQTGTIVVESGHEHGWYDFTLTIAGDSIYRQRFAGRIETGRWSISDPAMGGVV